tara:strand:- start:830 stop:976 length:147 start_codon:yes stop_codon:yes gene_type:complete
MKNRWERRETKQQKKKGFVSDNRKSVKLIAQLSLLPNRPKQRKRTKYR